MTTLDLISVDDHVLEHPMVWEDRLPASLRERGPRVVHAHGGDCWLFEDRLQPIKKLDVAAGLPFSAYSREPATFADMRRGCWDPRARVADMDHDGVRVSLCFPSFPRLCGQTFLEASDMHLADLCVRAWNDFMIDEWSAAAPERLKPLAIGQLWDPELFAQEIRRVAAKGARGIAFSENPYQLGLPSLHSPSWDPVWHAAAETGLPICLHVGSSSQMPHPAPDAPRLIGMALISTNAQAACTDLLLSRVPRVFPTLKFVLSEGGIGWVPFALERADRMWERHRQWANAASDERPSDVFRRSVWVCFIEEAFGPRLYQDIGADRIMWECDYPHSDSCWPDSQHRAHELLACMPVDVVAAVTHGNAQAVFGIAAER